MKKNKEEIQLVKEWLRFARENILYARAGMKEDFAPYYSICFLCQGSAEKYLKTYLIWNGWELKKIHNMNILLAFCTEYDPTFENFREECVILNKYITITRYPADLSFGNIGKNDATEAIDAADKIENFVINKLDFLSENDNLLQNKTFFL
ncbi:MAG: HEPN domain-containing protein [Bacteroidota bacterium]